MSTLTFPDPTKSPEDRPREQRRPESRLERVLAWVTVLVSLIAGCLLLLIFAAVMVIAKGQL